MLSTWLVSASGHLIFRALITLSEIPKAVAYTKYCSHKGNSTNVRSLIKVSLFKKLYNPLHLEYSSSPYCVNKIYLLDIFFKWNELIIKPIPSIKKEPYAKLNRVWANIK